MPSPFQTSANAPLSCGAPQADARAMLCPAILAAMRTLLWLLLPVLAAAQTRDLRIESVQPATPLGEGGTRWAVVIGVSSYQQLPAAAQLRYAHRDAEEFAQFLRSAQGGAIPGDHIRLLTNQQASL